MNKTKSSFNSRTHNICICKITRVPEGTILFCDQEGSWHQESGFKSYLCHLLAPRPLASHPSESIFFLNELGQESTPTLWDGGGLQKWDFPEVGTVLTLTLCSSLQQAKELINK